MIGKPQRTNQSRCGNSLNPKCVLGETGARISRIRNLKPTLSTFDIRADKLFVRLGEVHDAFHDSNHLHNDGQHAARQQRYQQHDDAFGLVTQNEFVNAEGAQEEATNTSCYFLVRASRLPILSAARLVQRSRRLNGLVSRLIVGLRLRRRLISNQR